MPSGIHPDIQYQTYMYPLSAKSWMDLDANDGREWLMYADDWYWPIRDAGERMTNIGCWYQISVFFFIIKIRYRCWISVSDIGIWYPISALVRRHWQMLISSWMSILDNKLYIDEIGYPRQILDIGLARWY